jgi:hypothetical protein
MYTSGQFQVPAVLLPGKEYRSLDKRLDGPYNWRGRCCDKYYALSGIESRFSSHPAYSLVAIPGIARLRVYFLYI